MATTKKLRKPHLVTDAMDVLDLGESQTGVYLRNGLLGPVRHPSIAEQKKFGLQATQWVIVDMGVVQRFAKARQKAAIQKYGRAGR